MAKNKNKMFGEFKLDTKNEIKSYLLSIEYEEIRKNVFRKEFELKNQDKTPGAPETIKAVREYKFGERNLQQFVDGVKMYSIPYSNLEIRNGRITKVVDGQEVDLYEDN